MRRLFSATLLVLVLSLFYVQPAEAGCPPDERPCAPSGTTTTKPAEGNTTVVTDSAPAEPNVYVNQPAQNQPNVTVTCYDYPAPSFDLTSAYRGVDGRLNIAGVPWEIVRDYLPAQIEWVNTHGDWQNFEAPCPDLYALGFQDKVDLETRKAELDRAERERIEGLMKTQNNAEEEEKSSSDEPAPTAVPAAAPSEVPNGPTEAECRQWQQDLGMAESDLAAAKAEESTHAQAEANFETKVRQGYADRTVASTELVKVDQEVDGLESKIAELEPQAGDPKVDRRLDGLRKQLQDAKARQSYWNLKFDDAKAIIDTNTPLRDKAKSDKEAAHIKVEDAQKRINIAKGKLKACPGYAA